MQTIETLGAVRLMHRITTKSGQKAKNHYLVARIAIKADKLHTAPVILRIKL